MKKLLATVLSIVLIISIIPMGAFSFTASAETSEYYTYTVSNGKATITDCDTSISGNVTIPSSLGGYPVTSIGDYAFENCTSLTSITIPDCVTSIGNGTFKYCDSLTSITLPFVGSSRTANESSDAVFGYIFGCTSSYESGTTEQKYSSEAPPFEIFDDGSYAYYYIPSSLNSVTITDATQIPYGAFYNCENLTSLTISGSVTSIDDEAFYNCTGLTSITIPDSVTSLDGSAFNDTAYYNNDSNWESGVLYIGKLLIKAKDSISGAYTIKEGTLYICYSAFYNCDNLTSITIPDSVKSIGDWAFDNCTGLTSITIPDSVTSIGWRVFSACAGLTSITIPDSVTSIDDEAFYNCTKLTSITIPDSVTSIGYRAFRGCTGLTSITIPDSVTSIGGSAFEYCTGLTGVYIKDISAWCGIQFGYGYSNPLYYAEKLYINGTFATDITIPDGVTSIGDYAFRNCTGLTSITIPDSVTSIGEEAFSDCTGLMSISVEKDNLVYHSKDNCLIKTENNVLVLGCKNSVIPNYVTQISDYVFDGCTGLTRITIPDSVTSIGGSAFRGCTGVETVDFNATNCTSMGSSSNPVFDDCSNLKTINIGENVTQIPNYAFKGCTGLTSIIIGNGVTSIGSSAFSNCTDLTTVNYNATNCTSMGSSSYPVFSGCSNLKTINIGDNVTLIPDYAFRDCTGLTSITISDSVTSIGNYAFYLCSGLDKVYYRGTAEQKSKMYIGSSNSDLSYYATWYYNSCINASTHTYDNNCDAVCNVCDAVRIPADHIYDNACDTICNVCKQSRMAPHDYKWIIDNNATCGDSGIKHEECSLCHIKKNENTVIDATNNHVYEWIIDRNATCGDTGVKHEECVVCHIKSKENTVIDATNNHVYEWIIDKNATCGAPGIKHEECSVCYIKRNENNVIEATGEHVYDNECDADCNNCNDKRHIEHVYSTNCDSDCNNCGAIRNVEHTYSNENDLTCDVCYESITPKAPVALNIYATSIRLMSVSGCEYSIDGINWQNSVLFEELEPEEEYTLYQRVKETSFSKQSSISEPLHVKTLKGYKITLCYNDGSDNEKIIIKTHGVSVDLGSVSNSGCVFRGWSKTPNGDELISSYSGNEDAKFYAKWKRKCTWCSATGYVYKAVEDYIICTTCSGKGTITQKDSSIRCIDCGSRDYRSDLIPTSFGGFGEKRTCNMCGSHKVGGGYIETITCTSCAGRGERWGTRPEKVICSSCDGKGSNKMSQPTAPQPEIKNIGAYFVELVSIDGAEYSMDGVNWQSTPVFNNLSKNSTYYFFQRYKANSINYVGASSKGLFFEFPENIVNIGDIDGVEGITDADAEYLLKYIASPENNPVNQECDFNDDGVVDKKDAEYLLLYTFFPEDYPLH